MFHIRPAGRQYLYRHKPVQPFVLGFENLTHTSGTQFFEELILQNRSPNHKLATLQCPHHIDVVHCQGSAVAGRLPFNAGGGNPETLSVCHVRGTECKTCSVRPQFFPVAKRLDCVAIAAK
jgi:hypothetical protein